jgi:DNA-binding SARP family transcriptional activator/tetratricopeptide (TPR) repeat protein
VFPRCSRRDNGNVVANGGAPDDRAVRVRLLGPFTVTSGGRTAGPWPRPSARRLCELVLLARGRRITRDLACEELFPDLDPYAAARSVSKALSMARSALAVLGTSLLEADLTHIWAAPAVQVDVDAHEQALRSALSAGPGQDRDDRLVAALAQDGELLADEPYTEWALRPRERLEALRQEARLTLARDRAKGAGRSAPDAVVQAWDACFEHDPACEEAAGALVRAHAAHGRRELAVRVYERCAAALDELGLRISPSLAEIFAAAEAASGPSASPAAGLASRELREELRPVSVLFAEVVAPSGAVRRLDPESLRDAVGVSLATMITEVEVLGGIVTSVSGGGLQAMFGAPAAHEDDPERAIRAAFRALAALTGTGAPALRIGVETGQALLGPIGGGATIGYGAVGEVVGTAAALQSAAMPGTALVGPVTHAATRHLFTWGTGAELALGAGANPLTATYLGSPLAVAAGREPGLGGSGQLVGRQAEMATLDAALREVIRGRGSFVLLTAEPGLGKTRLVLECRKRFLAWARPRGGRLPLWLEGRGTSYASATPFGLYQQLLASWVGVAADQPEQALRPALERALETTAGGADLFAPLARMMGLPAGAALGRMSAEEVRRTTFAALHSLISRLAAAGPAVLVLEDLHWADPTSVHLTSHLAGLVSELPLLVLATSRSDLTAPDRTVLDPAVLDPAVLDPAVLDPAVLDPAVLDLAVLDRTGPRPPVPVRRISLRRLPEAAERELALSLIGGAASQEVLDTVLTSVDGNPLFLEERLSSLIETKTLLRDRDSWRLGEVEDLVVPQALERLVLSRVDRLSPAARDAVRAASVLGTEFTLSQLTAVCGTTEPPREAVTELRIRDLIHEQPGQPEPTFRFRHALIQEATYNGLLRAERRLLHGRAAWALEAAALATGSADRLAEVAALLSHHFAAAGEDEPDLRYLELAGDHATAVFANAEAISLFRAAVAIVRSGRAGSRAAQAALLAKLANVLWRTARRDEARDAFTEALLAVDPADTPLRAHLLTRLGRLEMIDRHYQAAGKAFDQALVLLGEDPPAQDDTTIDQWLELTVDGLADLHAQLGESERAVAILETARPLVESGGRPARVYAFHHVLTRIRLLRNSYRVDEADIASMRAGLAAAELSDEEKDVGYATYFVGHLLLLHGDLTQAKGFLERSLALAERIGESILLGESMLGLAMIAVRRHDVDTVRSLVPRVRAAMPVMPWHEVNVTAFLAWLAWQDERPVEVIALAGQLVERADALGSQDLSHGWVGLWPLLASHLSQDDVPAAVAVAHWLLEPGQQQPPDELALALRAAVPGSEDTRDRLAAALALAHKHGYL